MPAISITDLNNAKTDVDKISEFMESSSGTMTTRLGATIQTRSGLAAEFPSASANAAAAAASAAAAALSEDNSSLSEIAAAASAGAAAASEAGAASASATAGAYPNTAASNVPRGLTQASVGAITAGSGGTNGTFALGWSGGNFTHNPTGTFTVAGGAVTAVTITGPGLYIGASPTVPTPTFTASAGLTGAAVALTAQFLVTAGQGYWVLSSDGKTLGHYRNVAGVATASTDVSAIPVASLVTELANQPFRREDFGPARYYPTWSIVTGTNVTIDSAGDQFTLGATTGNLVFTGNDAIPVAVGDIVAVWFEAITGVPSTAGIRFQTSTGANIGGADTAMTRVGSYYVVIATAPATTVYVRPAITNTSGSPIVISRPAVAIQKSTAKDGVSEPNVTALRHIMADGEDPASSTIWETNSVAKISGAGASPTIVGSTVVIPPDTISYARSDITSISTGDQLRVLVKLSSANRKARYVLVRLVGNGASGTQLTKLFNHGNGYWGRVITVQADFGTSFYMRVEVDNSTSAYYTAADVTIERISVSEGTQYPVGWPAESTVAGTYDKTEVVLQQTSGGINVFTPGSNPATSKYVSWQLRQFNTPDSGPIGSGWTMQLLHEAARTGDAAFTIGNQLTDNGEHWLAVRENGKSHMGGKVHGYQVAGTNLGACTITIASPGVVTKASHGLAAGDRVVFTTSGALPTGITAGTPYYVIATGLTANDFQFSATSGGAAINTSGSQSGTHTLRKRGERLMVDGAKKTIDGATSYRGRRIEFFQKSQLLDTSDGVTPRFDVITTAIFDKDGLRLRHRLTALGIINLSSAYLAMLSMSRWINNTSASGEQFSNAYWSPDYTEATTAVQADVENSASRYIISGSSGYTVDMEVTEGWTIASRESFVQRGTNTVKIYQSPVGINQAASVTVYTTTNGEVIEMETLIRVNTAN